MENCCGTGYFFMVFQRESGYVVVVRLDELLKTISHLMQNASPKLWLGSAVHPTSGHRISEISIPAPQIPEEKGYGAVVVR